MATQIQLTRSGTPGAQPTATEMELGELALNYADGKLYFKNDSNNIEQLNSTYNNSGQKIFVNEEDNHIGLNTILPEFLLDLGGGTASGDNTLRLNQNDDGTAIRIGGSAAGDITLLRVDNADGETDSTAEGFSIKYLGSNNHELGIFADNTSSEVQALTVLQDGKVGINTPTPVAELDVTGDVEVSGTINSNAVTTTDITATGDINLTIDTINIAAGAVTSTKIADANVTTAKIADANVTTGKIADANVTFAKLTDVIDDDTMATASATKLATSESIKAYVTAMRPKFVSLTGGSTDLSKTTTSVSTVDYTYNIADFTSSDPDFATNKIVALIISSFTSSSQGANIVQARLPDEVFTGISRTSADSTADFTQDSSTTTIPINSGQESTVIRHIVTDSQTSAAQSTIRGAIIQPGL